MAGRRRWSGARSRPPGAFAVVVGSIPIRQRDRTELDSEHPRSCSKPGRECIDIIGLRLLRLDRKGRRLCVIC